MFSFCSSSVKQRTLAIMVVISFWFILFTVLASMMVQTATDTIKEVVLREQSDLLRVKIMRLKNLVCLQ